MRTVERRWPPTAAAALALPRHDIVAERTDDGTTFVQVLGPFSEYARTVRPAPDGPELVETTRYGYVIPWFGWLFALPVRWTLRRSRHDPVTGRPGATPWWAPPDLLTPRNVLVLGLLAAASMSSAFINTLFTQTVSFAGDDFGVSDSAVGIAGSLVRAGIVLVLPAAALADRRGRRTIVVAVAVAAPLVTAAGALAPTFPFLVATQALGRPLGLVLDFMVAVVAAEEMPRNSRAYAVSVLALASGLGAGVAILALPLADLSPGAWRYVYLVSLIWLVVAVDLARRLPESERFERPHVTAPPLDRRRFGVLATIALLSNLFIAPASLFQNGYLKDERGFDATTIAVFTLVTATPAGLGLILGGHLADTSGRRRLIAIALPVSTAFIVVSYSVGGPLMWVSVLLGAVIGGIAFPALAVYRAELFPTGNRGRAAGLLTAAALLGGVVGLVVTGQALDAGAPHGLVLGALASAQVIVVAVVLTSLPETAHRDLDELNPLDRAPA